MAIFTDKKLMEIYYLKRITPNFTDQKNTAIIIAK